MWSLRLMLAAVLLCSAIAPALGEGTTKGDERTKDLMAENARLRRELDQARDEIAALRKQLEAATRESVGLAQEKRDLQTENTRLEQLAGMTAKGEAIKSAIARIKADYNSSGDRTIVASTPLKPVSQSSNVNAEHRVTFEYDHAGKKLAGDPSAIRLVLTAYFRPNTKYSSQKTIGVILDGQRLDVPVAADETVGTNRTPSPLGTMTRYHERITATLTSDQLRTISIASEASVEFAGNTMEMPREFLATAGAMRERIKLGQ